MHTSPHRAYRSRVARHADERLFQVTVGESDLLISASDDLRTEVAALLTRLRSDLLAWISLYPEFRTSLVPLDVPDEAPELVRRMAAAGRAAYVGPFAAVAGAVAQAVGEAFRGHSPDLIVENGGDVYMCSTKPRVVGLLADPDGGTLMGVHVAPEDCPVSFCASSGRIGHSLSFGLADLVVVRSPDAALADACATSLANGVRTETDIPALLERAQSIAGVEGVFVQCDGKMGLWGKMELA